MDTESAINAELQRQKTTARNLPRDTDDITSITPNWLITLKKEPGMTSIQAQTLLAKFIQLLDQLPLVQQTGSRGAMLAYLKGISVELTKIYYVRMRIVELDEMLSATQCANQLSVLENELQHRIMEIAKLLGDYNRP